MGCFPNRKKDIIIENNNTSNISEIKILKKFDSKINQSLKKFKIERGLFVQGFSGDPFEKYEILTNLGEGSYGKVYKVKLKNSDIYRAMKVIKIRYKYNTQETEKIKKEIQILRQLDHPNIIKVFEFYNTNQNFYIISELCNGGELFDKIVKLKKLNEKVAAYVMKQILSAVQFCHKNQILHRDLKPENILIETETGTEKENNLFIVKVIDFGTAEIFKNNTLLSKQIGTPYYIAPEVLNNQYNEKCDMWSCGVILYILLCGCPPFYGKNDKEIFESVKSGKYSYKNNSLNEISENAKSLIKNLLDLDFNKRPTAEKSLKHPWFINILEENSKIFDDTHESDNDSILNKNETGLDQRLINNHGLKEALLNLKNFRAERKLQQATLYFMVQQLLPNEDVKGIRDIFFKFDENQDGRLTKEEILKGFRKSKFCFCSAEELEKIMDLVDIDKNGYIEYQEFILATFSKKKILTDDNLKRSFDMFDRDKSGKISANELKQVLSGSNEENKDVWKNIIKDIDLDGDGEISYYEFRQMMYNLVSSA